MHTYAAVLNLLAAKSATRAHAAFFTKCASQVLSEEMQMHDQLMRDWGISEEDVEQTPLQPAGLFYDSFLRATILDRPYHEGACKLSASPEYVIGMNDVV